MPSRRVPPPRLSAPLRRLAGLAWALPWTLAGLVLAVPALALGARLQRCDGALEVSGGWLGRCIGQGPWAALTLGHVILATSAAEARRLAAHERVHVRQYERWGPLFVPAYLLAGAWQWACGRDPYLDNPFERAAHLA